MPSLIDRKMKNPVFRKSWMLEYPLFEVEAQLLKAFEDSGLTYKHLAKKTGTSKSNICRDFKCNGIKKATLQRIAKIAYALGLSPIILFVKKENRKYFADKISRIFDDPSTYAKAKSSRLNGLKGGRRN